jgi:hypothetical protein
VSDGDDSHLLVVTQEVDLLWTMMFFRFDEQLDEWVLHLVLQFDMRTSINWVASDEESNNSNTECLYGKYGW